MSIYDLKRLINALELENLAINKYLLEFYYSLYQDQINKIADQVLKQLNQGQAIK